MKYFKPFRQYDMFGHLITMNFNKRGAYHKTVFGAFFSIIIKFAIYVYVALTFQTLLTMGADKNTTIGSILDIKDFGLVNYNTTGHFHFYVLMHQENRR